MGESGVLVTFWNTCVRTACEGQWNKERDQALGPQPEKQVSASCESEGGSAREFPPLRFLPENGVMLSEFIATRMPSKTWTAV